MLVAQRGLPGSRAVLGGLLVTVAGLGTWWAATGAGTASSRSFVVAKHLIAPGDRLKSQDLQLASAELSPSLRKQSFAEVADLVGQVALGPIGPGGLVQSGMIGPPAGIAAGTSELSFLVDTEWAVAGSLAVGDRVDIFATQTSAASSSTKRVLANTTIRRVAAAGGDGLGEHRSQVLTVGIEPPTSVRDFVDATRAATITVVRVTGTPAALSPRSSTRSTGTNSTRPSK